MDKPIKVIIDWSFESEGGLAVLPPIGERYPMRISASNIPHEGILWNVLITNTSIDERMSEADISFLEEGPPREVLRNGQIFDLFKGFDLVAVGMVK